MDKDKFIIVWNEIVRWNDNNKALFKLGVDISKHDKLLYNIVIHLLLTHYNQAQVDFILWSIFDDVREIPVGDETVTINTGELCWEYIQKWENKLEEITDEEVQN